LSWGVAHRRQAKRSGVTRRSPRRPTSQRPAGEIAKRLECVQLAGALGRLGAHESGSKLLALQALRDLVRRGLQGERKSRANWAARSLTPMGLAPGWYEAAPLALGCSAPQSHAYASSYFTRYVFTGVWTLSASPASLMRPKGELMSSHDNVQTPEADSVGQRRAG